MKSRAFWTAVLLPFISAAAGAAIGDVSTYVGRARSYGDGGPALSAAFNHPHALAVAPDGTIYVGDTYNRKIRKITPAGQVSTLVSGLWAYYLLYADGYVYGDGWRVSASGAFQGTSWDLSLADSDGAAVYRMSGDALIRVADPLSGTGPAIATLPPSGGWQALAYAAGEVIVAGATATWRVPLASSAPAQAATVPWAQLRNPAGFASDGTYLYVVESFPFPYAAANPADNVHRVRRVHLGTGALSDFLSSGSRQGDVDGAGTLAAFSFPQAIQVHGGHLYLADMYNHKIKRASLGAGAVETVAGGGLGYAGQDRAAATLNNPLNVVVDEDGTMYIAELGGQKVLKVSPAGVVTAIAGSNLAGEQDAASGTSARFRYPCHVAIDGNFLYVADFGTHKIRRIHKGTGEVSTLAGRGVAGFQDGRLSEAAFSFPWGIFARDGRVYVADTGNDVIREIDLALGVVRTVAGSPGSAGHQDGVGAAARFNGPRGLAVHGDEVFIADADNHVIRKLDLRTRAVSTVAGVPQSPGLVDLSDPTMVRFTQPWGVSFDDLNVYVADTGNNRIRRIVRSSGETSTLAGSGVYGDADGAGASASFYLPHGLFARQESGQLFVADIDNHKIRAVSIPVRIPAKPPEPPKELLAKALPGRKIELSWVKSPSAGATEHRVYVATAGAAFDFFSPAARLGASSETWTASGLVDGTLYRFIVRAAAASLEEKNTNEASAVAFETLTCPAASIKNPHNGKKVSGNSLTIMAETDAAAADVRFQYRPLYGETTAFTDVPARNADNHPNPDASSPYFIHWDVSGLPNGEYLLRALARCPGGGYPDDAPRVTIQVEHSDPDEEEADLGDAKEKTAKVSAGSSNRVELADEDTNNRSELRLPAGALSSANDTVTLTLRDGGVSGLSVERAANVLARLDVTLASGQSQLLAPAQLTFHYDARSLLAAGLEPERLTVLYYDPALGRWTAVASTAGGGKVTALLSHFSTYGMGVLAAAASLGDLRVFPSPYVPGDGVDDNGKPYSSADPNSGIVFDSLTADATIEVFDVTGRRVWRHGAAGASGRVQWDARSSDGQDVASGVYFAIVRGGGQTATRKLAVIR